MSNYGTQSQSKAGRLVPHALTDGSVTVHSIDGLSITQREQIRGCTDRIERDSGQGIENPRIFQPDEERLSTAIRRQRS